MKHSEPVLLVLLMMLGGGALFAHKPPTLPVATPTRSRDAFPPTPINDICPLSGRKVDSAVPPLVITAPGTVVLIGLCGECCRIRANAAPPERLLEAARGNAVLRGLYFAILRQAAAIAPSGPIQTRCPHGPDVTLHRG